MERLVIPNKAGSLCYNDTDQGLKLEPNEITSHQRWLLVERLHEYEDTGLTPDQIEVLKKRDTGVKPRFLDGWDTCGNCGERIMSVDRFCSECGQRLKWEE